MNTQIILKIPTNLQKAQAEIEESFASGQKNICLDFSMCNFISVDGLEWLEELLVRAKSNHTEVSIINVQPSIYKVFKVAHIDNILHSLGSSAPSGPYC